MGVVNAGRPTVLQHRPIRRWHAGFGVMAPRLPMI